MPAVTMIIVFKQETAPVAKTNVDLKRRFAPPDVCFSVKSMFQFGTLLPRLSRCRTLPKEQRSVNCFTFGILASPSLVLPLQSSEAEEPHACACPQPSQHPL
jgi:hypothetical protein